VVVSEGGGELFAGQQRARMPVEEQQQVEVAGFADGANALEQRTQILCVHACYGPGCVTVF